VGRQGSRHSQAGEVMPYRPARPCKVPSCPGLTLDPSGYCPKHEGMKRPSEATRSNESRQRFETGRAWRGIRKCYLSHNPLCFDCMAQGIVRQAEEVHHIDNDHTNNLDSNLMALCIRCHSRRTANDLR
jgi:5-methylcytosine-specific restriction protein A